MERDRCRAAGHRIDDHPERQFAVAGADDGRERGADAAPRGGIRRPAAAGSPTGRRHPASGCAPRSRRPRPSRRVASSAPSSRSAIASRAASADGQVRAEAGGPRSSGGVEARSSALERWRRRRAAAAPGSRNRPRSRRGAAKSSSQARARAVRTRRFACRVPPSRIQVSAYRAGSTISRSMIHASRPAVASPRRRRAPGRRPPCGTPSCRAAARCRPAQVLAPHRDTTAGDEGVADRPPSRYS